MVSKQQQTVFLRTRRALVGRRFTEDVGSTVLMQFCTASMSAIIRLTKHGAIIPTHTPYLVICQHARHGGGTKLHYYLNLLSITFVEMPSFVIFPNYVALNRCTEKE